MAIKETEAGNFYCCNSSTQRRCSGKKCMAWQWYSKENQTGFCGMLP